MLTTSGSVNLPQVFKHYQIVQTFYYQDQLKPLAQNCAKIQNVEFPNTLFSSKIEWNQTLTQFCINFTEISQKLRKISDRKNSSLSTLWHSTVWKNEIFTITQNISSNQLISIFFSKNVTFTKFLSKKSDSKFPQFPHFVVRVLSLFHTVICVCTL